MGHGIAQVAAAARMQVVLFDVSADLVAAGHQRIVDNLDKGLARGKVTADERERTLAHLRTSTDRSEVASADLVVEAVPEKLDLKQALFADLARLARPQTVFATNTSSLSIARIASALPDPAACIGTHFFNPVHLMALLEIVYHKANPPELIDRIEAFGQRIGKECIRVQDTPGFATSRLGVALGMEAIRMVEQGVASPADIDKAMVLGYRHPVGPLRLSDMVGLDVRMAIGEYLARELGNPAFAPPALMRQMVSEGRLGQKTGRGFYDWP
jgi:3-hydroxybutyryl-CoA dehydrogenase